MALLQTAYATGAKAMPNVRAGHEPVAVYMEYSLSAALALNDIIEMGLIAPGTVPFDATLAVDDLDTGTPAIVLQVGVLNAGKTDIDTTASGGANWFGSLTTAQAGGFVRATDKAISRVPPSAVQQSIGIKVSTGPGTGATTGKVGLTVWFRSAAYGM